MTSEWKPIESAPKNCEVDLWGIRWEPEDNKFVGKRFPGFTMKTKWTDSGFTPEREIECGWEGESGRFPYNQYRPTHWMPLPPKPQEDAG